MNDKITHQEAEDMFNNMRFERRDPHQIAQHALNWKNHPSFQREAYAEFHDEVGWAGALLYNDATHRLLDGHMRLQDALENNYTEVPVLVIEVDEQKELAILRYLDELGTLYQKKKSAAETLEAMISSRSDILAQLSRGDIPDEEDGDSGDEPNLGVQLPEGGLSLVLGEQYNYIVLLFKTEMDWVGAQDFFDLKRVKCVFNSGLGVGRVVDGSAVMGKLYNERAGISAKGSVLNKIQRPGQKLINTGASSDDQD